MAKYIRINPDLTRDEAEAFAEFLKRVQPEDYQRRAGDEREARLMYDTGVAIAASLRRIGIDPR